VRVQVHRHDVSSKDRRDGPQCSAAPPGNHRGLPEGPGRVRQAVTFDPFVSPPPRFVFSTRIRSLCRGHNLLPKCRRALQTFGTICSFSDALLLAVTRCLALLSMKRSRRTSKRRVQVFPHGDADRRPPPASSDPTKHRRTRQFDGVLLI